MKLRRLLQEIEYRRLRQQLTEPQLRDVLHHAHAERSERSLRVQSKHRRRAATAQVMAALATIHTTVTTGIITLAQPVQTAGLPLTIFVWGASLYTTLAVAHRMINLTRPRWHWVR